MTAAPNLKTLAINVLDRNRESEPTAVREFKGRNLGAISPAGRVVAPADAERLAAEAAIARWLNEHLPHDVVADTCAACGAALGPTRGLPLADGALVCEAEACWREYVRKRRSEAEAAMSP